MIAAMTVVGFAVVRCLVVRVVWDVRSTMCYKAIRFNIVRHRLFQLHRGLMTQAQRAHQVQQSTAKRGVKWGVRVGASTSTVNIKHTGAPSTASPHWGHHRVSSTDVVPSWVVIIGWHQQRSSSVGIIGWHQLGVINWGRHGWSS